MVVEVRALRNTEASLLKERQKAPAVSDAISSEDISRADSGAAAEAISHVTGATVMEGKYVYIRGARRSLQYGAAERRRTPQRRPQPPRRADGPVPLQHAGEYRHRQKLHTRQAGQLHRGRRQHRHPLFPRRLHPVGLGVDDLQYPEQLRKAAFSPYDGGSYDWLGMDDGTRDLPDQLVDEGIEIPDIGEAFGDLQIAEELDQLSESFSPTMALETLRAQLSNSNSFAVGNQVTLLGKPLGFLGSISYSRKLAHYDGGKSGRWQLTGSVESVEGLTNNFLLDDTRSAEEVLWGSLLSATYRFRPSGGASARVTP